MKNSHLKTRHSSTRTVVQMCGMVSVALIAGSGCGSAAGKGEPTTKPVLAQSSWESDNAAPTALQPTNRPVSQGPLPLFYLVESESTIRVTNVATGEEIATFPAKGGEIVRVETRGVLLANRPVLGAQLAAGTYAIERLTPDAGVIHVQQTRSMPVMPPTSRPTTQPASP